MSLLGSTNTYDAHIGSLGLMDTEVGNTSPQSTPHILSSFEEYTPRVTYPVEVGEILGTPMEEGSLDQRKLEDVGLDTCNHNISLSSIKVPSFNETEPQPQPLPNCPSLDVILGDERGPKPPIKPHSPNSFRMKVILDKEITEVRRILTWTILEDEDLGALLVSSPILSKPREY
ncbi:hypothetical protein Tco_0667310 [Tanacetum coccineum]